MVAPMSVAVAPSTLLQLMEYLRDNASSTDPAETVDAAIRYWLAAQRDAGNGKRRRRCNIRQAPSQ